MLINSLLCIIISLCLIIILSNSPISLGLWVIMSTLIISSTISVLIPSWFSLTIFLIYVGGLLVIFAYFLSIQPNQQIKILKILFTLTLSALLLTPITMALNLPHTQEKTNYTIITEMLVPYNIQIFAFLALALFLALVAVVKVTKIYMGPLRPFKYVPTYSKIPPSWQNYQQ